MQTQTKVIPALKPLVEFLEQLTQRAPMEELAGLLRESDLTKEMIAPYVNFGAKTYRRNLICESNWYELLCICWRSGQRSPIHDHAESTCGLRIIQGVCTETVFESAPNGQIKAVCSTDFESGHVCATQDDDVHQISNLQPEGTDLVTLHVYSPPLRAMAAYSMIGAQTEVYKPVNADILCHLGDGI